MTIDLTMIVAAVIASLSIGRITRFLVDDEMPFFEWFRVKYTEFTLDRAPKWSGLLECPHCTAVWVGMPITAWAFASELHWTWWALNGYLAVSYIGGIVNARDIPPES